MNEQDYSDQLNRLGIANHDNLLELANWAKAEGLPWLWKELNGVISDRVVKPLKPHDAIRKGLQVTHADRSTMPRKSNFYIAQLTMLDDEVKRYCEAVINFEGQEPPYAAATIHTLHVALKAHLEYGRILLEQAGHVLLDLPGAYGAWSRRVEESFEIYKGAEQIVYGTYSGMTHTDRAPFTPIAVLRTAIEIRLRSAFGIEGYVDSSNNAFVPIDLRRLLDTVKEHLPKIQFAVDFYDIDKIYRWCNFYLHAGWRDFPWVVGFAVQFLRPLFADRESTPNGGWSIHGGIRMNREEWRSIRSRFEQVEQNVVLNPAEEDNAKCVFLN